ncbi:MAG: beta strand repeat-containing protein, partial [Cytophagales bacterium]
GLVINAGGTLDLKTFALTTLAGLSGQGLLRLNSTSFPVVASNTFSASNGGTVEYYNLSATLPTSVTTYNNLWLTKDDNTTNTYLYTLGSNLTTNGDLRIRNLLNLGTSVLSIGNSTTARTLNVLGSVVNGDAAGNASTAVISLSGFNAQHIANIYGDLLNYGTVDFSNDVQYATPTQSLKLNFLGSSNRQFFCDGPTQIFDLSLRKGTDQTYVLHLNATSASYFTSHSNGNIFDTDGNTSRGTLRLGNNINMTRINGAGNVDLGSGTNAGFGIWIDGANIILATLSSRTSEAMVVYSKFRVSNGIFTIGQQGLVTRQDGEVVIEGGTINTTKYRTSDQYTQTPRGSFNMSGGVLNIDPTNISGASDADFSMFCLPYDEQIFIMSGGIVNIYTQQTGNNGGIQIAAKSGNYNVTGGTFNVTVVGAAGIFNINSTAPLYNLNVYATAANTSQGVTMTTQANPGDVVLPNPFPALPLTIINNLFINGTIPAKLSLGSQTLNLNKDFQLATNARLDATSGTINFNGSSAQTALINGAVLGAINNVSVNTSNNSTVSLQGSLSVLTITSLNLNSGVLNDGAKNLRITGNVVINGTHTGNGNIELAGTSTQSITSNGNGVFNNLLLNNTNGAIGSVPVSLSGNLRISTALNLVSDRIFDINTSGITFLSNSIVTTTGNSFSSNKFLRTSGNQSDVGISRFTFNNATTLLYPIGTGTNYTPVTATISGISTSANQGYLQISVNNAVLSTLSVTGVANSALLYNWRVRGVGFVTPPQVTYSFNSSVAGIWPTGVIGAGNFVGGRVVVPSRTAESTTVTSNGLIAIASHTIPTDALYTAAQTGRFNGSVRIFYSRASAYGGGAFWDVASTWSFTTFAGVANTGGATPGANDVVYMGYGFPSGGGSSGGFCCGPTTGYPHWTAIRNSTTVAGVVFQDYPLAGAWSTVIYLGDNINVNLGTVLNNSANSSGTIIYNINTPTNRANLFGDLGQFNNNSLNYVWYILNNNGTVAIQEGITNYPSFRIEGLGGAASGTRVFTLPTNNVVINGALNVVSRGSVLLFNTTSGANLEVKGNVDIGGNDGDGEIRFPTLGIAKTLKIGGNLSLTTSTSSTAAFGISVLNSTPSSLIHTLQVSGNISQAQGRLDLYSVGANGNQVNLELLGAGVNRYTRTGGTAPSLYKLIVNKGTNQISTFSFLNTFTLNGAANEAIKPVSFQNGILILSSSGVNINLSSGNGNVSIPSTSGLEVYNGSTVSMSSATGIVLDGLLRIGNNGVANFNDGISNTYIEYSASNNARLEIVNNASLNIGGQIRRSTTSTDGNLQYVQTGGNVTVAGIGAIADRAKFELVNDGSSINMSGGNFYIQRGGGTTFWDLYLVPSSSNITGGSFIFSPLTTIGSQNYSINSVPALHNLSFQSVGTSSATGTMFVNTLKTNNQLTLGSNSILNTNGFDVDAKGSVSIAGAYLPTTSTLSFTGNSLQNLVIDRATSFNNVVINNSNVVSLSGLNSTINGILNINAGTINDGGTNIVSNGNIINNGNHTGSGRLVLAGTSSPKEVSGSGSFQNIEVNKAGEVNFNNNTSVNGTISFVNGSIYLGANSLSLGLNASFTGLSSTRFVRSNGVKSDLGITKSFGASAFDFTFPVGVFGKYTPVRYQATSNSASGTIKVTPVNSA